MFYPQATLPLSRERALMGGAPYKSGVGTILSVSTIYHERAPRSCLQQFGALQGNNWT